MLLENFCFRSFTLKLTRMRMTIWYDTWNQPEIGYYMFVLNTSSILSPTNLFLRISGWGHQEGKTWHGDKIYVWLHSLNKLWPGGCCSDATWTLPTTLACMHWRASIRGVNGTSRYITVPRESPYKAACILLKVPTSAFTFIQNLLENYASFSHGRLSYFTKSHWQL